MTAVLRLLRNLLAFAVVAFSMTAPATAWDAHEISHINNPVAVDEHHHHDGGAVQAAGHGHDAPDPAGGKDDAGHDHMPSLSAAVNAIVVNGPITVFPPLTGVSPPAYAAVAPVDLIEPPPARPPRTI